jgi:hypothetical protein
MQCEANLVMNCVAGPGIKLEPSLKCRHQLRDLSATNALASSSSDRLVTKSLEFILKDRYGNDAMFPEGCHVVCRLSRHTFEKANLTHETLPRTTPQFLESILPSGHGGGGGGGSGGVDHLTAVPMTQYSQQFPIIELYPTDEMIGGDGVIQVTFELLSRHQLLDSKNMIEKFSFLFHFTTDEDRAIHERQYREEISPYQQQLEQLLDEQRKTEMEFHGVKQQLREIIQRADGLLLGEYLSTSQLTQSDVSLSSLCLCLSLPLSLTHSFD